MHVSENKIVADFDLFADFVKAAEKAVLDRKFVHISYDGQLVSLHVEGNTVSVALQVAAEGKAKSFTAGVDADRFLAAFKKLYKGEVTLKFSKASVQLIKDNIKIKFPIISGRSYIDNAEGAKISGEEMQWLISNLVYSLSTIEEMGKKPKTEKFLGVLFETTEKVSRLTKFSQSSLYFSATQPIFAGPYRVLIPDVIALMCRLFPKNILSFIFASNKIGLCLEHGLSIYASMPYDTYPTEHIKALGLSEDVDLIPEGAYGYAFEVENLLNAVDLVATTLGEAESWISLSTVGKFEGNLVWEIGGKTYNGIEVSEKVVSSDGPIVEAFGVNKKRMLRCLSTFEQTVLMYDLNNSTLALADEQGTRAALLIKALI